MPLSTNVKPYTREMLRRLAAVTLIVVCTVIVIVCMSSRIMKYSPYYGFSHLLSASQSESAKYELRNSGINRTDAASGEALSSTLPGITRGIIEDMMRHYESDRKGCSVKHRTDGPSKEQRDAPPCSREVFREFVATRDAFPWEGTLWGNTTDPHYQPSFCTLDTIGRFEDLGGKCTHSKQNNLKIVVYGDSNVYQLKSALIRTLKSLGATCFQERTEKFDDPQTRIRDVNYFATRDFPAEYLQGVRSIYRGGGDMAKEYKCIHVNSFGSWNITVEYISATRLVDTSISMGKELSRTLMFSSFNEYLFRHYYKDKGYPDALFIWVPLHHMKWFTSLRKLALDVSYLDQLARIYLPATTQIYWIPDSRECHNPDWLMPNGLRTNQMLYVMNRILYETLRSRFLNTNGSVYPFLDLGRIVCDVTCVWHKDGGHMIRGFYSMLSRIMLQLACW